MTDTGYANIIFLLWFAGVVVNSVVYVVWLIGPPRSKYLFSPAVALAVLVWPLTLLAFGSVALHGLVTVIVERRRLKK